MQYRRLGTTEYRASVVGMGTWAIGGPLTSWAPVDDNESIAAIREGVELGINLIDTAPSYGYGHSEEIVGKAISTIREKVLVASKCGLVWREPGGRLDRSLRRESIRRECEASLRRLRVDMIDLYQIEAPDPLTPIGTAMESLAALREEGKIGAVGVCNFNCQQLGEARRHGAVDCLQLEMSLLEAEAADELLPYCREYGIGVLACGPLARGLLTGKFDTASRPRDMRSGDPRFTGDAFRGNLAVVDCLRPLADELGCTVGQLALRWVIEQEGVTAALGGIKRPSQARENAGAGDLAIPASILERIDRILRERE